MKVKDLIMLTDKPQHKIAYAINITPTHLSKIKKRRIGNLSRDLQLKIRLFCIDNKIEIKQRINEITNDQILLRLKDQ